MKHLLLAVVGLLGCSALADHPPSKQSPRAVLLEGLGNLHHPVEIILDFCQVRGNLSSC
jgi:hypothetical protein